VVTWKKIDDDRERKPKKNYDAAFGKIFRISFPQKGSLKSSKPAAHV
jgi:hypothetical protein